MAEIPAAILHNVNGVFGRTVTLIAGGSVAVIMSIGRFAQKSFKDLAKAIKKTDKKSP